MSDDKDEREEKQLKDYTALVNEKVPEYVEPAKKNPDSLNEALEKLLALEKKTRLAADAPSTEKVSLAVLQLLFDLQKWSLLNDHITLICKRRAQLKKVMQSVIQTAVKWIDHTPNEQVKRELIATLRAVSAGKIFVEVERARLTRMLSQLEEKDGKINEAADILQEVHVETIGAMEVREKADFLLEQLRLCLTKKDQIRSELVAKKINAKVLDGPDLQDLKLKYYRLMIQFYHISNNYLAICKAYRAIFDTPQIKEDAAQWKEALKNAVIYVLLSPFDSEVSDLLHRIKEEKKLADLSNCKQVLDQFTTDELMKWPLVCDAEWRADAIFNDGEPGKKRYEDLRKRIIQHNIRTIAMNYHRIQTPRLAQLLELTEAQTEDYLSELVSSKQLFAKVDRPIGIVTFTRPQTADTLLNTWSSDISELLSLVEKTCHLIHKENMLHKIGEETA